MCKYLLQHTEGLSRYSSVVRRLYCASSNANNCSTLFPFMVQIQWYTRFVECYRMWTCGSCEQIITLDNVWPERKSVRWCSFLLPEPKLPRHALSFQDRAWRGNHRTETSSWPFIAINKWPGMSFGPMVILHTTPNFLAFLLQVPCCCHNDIHIFSGAN